MGLIQVLPELVANKIAAGEVIERPASIVKELVENSLDAGAKFIEVAVRHGGKSMIRVSDDGAGMSAEDAEIAFKRYATSKIRDAQDLAAIASYGFRGEALPSIAAVSRVKLTTRLEKNISGTEITMEGGNLTGAKESGCAKGTTIEVRDLFFNTPARRKFLKTDNTEMGQIQETLSNLAFSRLDVRFVFKASDKLMFDVPAKQTLKQRAAVLWDEETAKNLIEIAPSSSPHDFTAKQPFRGRGSSTKTFEDDKNTKARIWGVIGKPSISKSNRLGQIFFVNGRLVKSPSLGYGLLAGYHGLLMHGQFPVAVISIDLDLERVDVNVHPTKQEVRISNEAEIKTLLKDCVSQCLEKEEQLAPQMRMPSVLTGERAAAGFPAVSPEFRGGRENRQWPSSSRQEESRAVAAEPLSDYSVRNAEILPDALLLRNNLKITKVLGQIHHTFIVAETEEGMMLIDQHAAHERVNFEALLSNFQTANPARQRLLMDEMLEVTPKQLAIFEEARGFLEKIGFEVDGFGEKTLKISSMPAVLADENPALMLKAFFEECEEGKLRTSLENYEEDIAALIACKKKSVKARDAMTAESIRHLLERLAVCKNPFSCPHGRPTFLQYTFLDFEKQFKRK